MARQHKKKANRHLAYPTTGLSPFFSNVAPGPLWRWLFPCLIAAFALRVWVGLSGDWFARPDEFLQYLEQAHRWVFGYGQVTWEYRIGLRTWLLPMIPAIPLWLCKFIGFTHPDVYIPAVKIWNALLSLAIPAGMYAITRRVIGETVACLALLFGCFWHEFIVLGTHALSEQYATSLFFFVLVLLSPAASNIKLLVIGVLLGLTVALRLPYLPFAGAFGLVLLTAYPLHRWVWLMGGGVIGLLFWGLFDYLTWGRWWHSPWLYADILAFHDTYEEAGIYISEGGHFRHLGFMTNSSFGLYLLALVTLPWWRRYWMLLIPVAVVTAFHLALTNQEYTNLFILWPILWILIAAAAFHITVFANHKTFPWLRHSPQIIFSAAIGITLIIFASGIPNIKRNYLGINPTEKWPIHSEISVAVSRWFAALPSNKVRAIRWELGQNQNYMFLTGGYYYMHHRVPIFFPEILADHKEFLAERNDYAGISHVVANKDRTFPGFSLTQEFGNIGVFTTLLPPVGDLSDGFATDLQWNAPIAIEKTATRLGIYYPPPSLSPLKEDFSLF